MRREDVLRHYLRNHYAASRGGLDLFRRAAGSQRDPTVREELSRLSSEVAEDRSALLAMMVALGIARRPVQEWVVALGERLGRLKPNGTLLTRSPLSDLLELEALIAGVEAKKRAWLSLRCLADGDEALDASALDHLIRRAEDQSARMEQQRQRLVPGTLEPDRTSQDWQRAS